MRRRGCECGRSSDAAFERVEEHDRGLMFRSQLPWWLAGASNQPDFVKCLPRIRSFVDSWRGLLPGSILPSAVGMASILSLNHSARPEFRGGIAQPMIDFVAARCPFLPRTPQYDTDHREHILDDEDVPTTRFLLDPFAQEAFGASVGIVQVLHQITPVGVRVPTIWRQIGGVSCHFRVYGNACYSAACSWLTACAAVAIATRPATS